MHQTTGYYIQTSICNLIIFICFASMNSLKIIVAQNKTFQTFQINYTVHFHIK